MKQKLTILTILTIFMLLMTTVKAQTIEERIQQNNINPNSPFYSIDKTIENIRLRVTTNERKKVELRLNFAQERLTEIKNLKSEDKIKYIENVMKNYKDHIENAKKESETFNESVREKVRKRMQKQQQILEQIKERIKEDNIEGNDNAIEGINKAIQNSKKHQENMRE